LEADVNSAAIGASKSDNLQNEREKKKKVIENENIFFGIQAYETKRYPFL
jgi:hypothetical protein